MQAIYEPTDLKGYLAILGLYTPARRAVTLAAIATAAAFVLKMPSAYFNRSDDGLATPKKEFLIVPVGAAAVGYLLT